MTAPAPCLAVGDQPIALGDGFAIGKPRKQVGIRGSGFSDDV